MAVLLSVLLCCLLASVHFRGAVAYTPKAVIYWGQDSGSHEKNLASYCTGGVYDIIVLGFVDLFPKAPGGSQYPGLNFANHCETYYDQSNPYLLICPAIGADITTCQAAGVKIILSFGGGSGSYGFSSDSQASAFATTVWNMFLGGSSSIRPFGSAVVDGVDLDIETGTTTGYAAFVSTLRTYYASASKTYYITAAPQCVYPDTYLGPGAGTALQNAWFDFVWVQFYNNYCGLNQYSEGNFNFNVWANWATTISVNPNVKVLIGAPAGPSAAGSGYVPISTLTSISNAVASSYPNIYGGIMLWDCGNSENNNNYGNQVSALVHSQTVSSSSTTTSSTTSRPVATTAAATPVTTGRTIVTTHAPAPVTTAAATPVTTARSIVTTGAPTPVTTAAPTPVTTARAVVTTGAPTPVTTAKATTAPRTSAALTTARTVATTSRLTTSSTATCTDGYMTCVTSTSFSICDHGAWAQTQPCGDGTTCVQAGNYIYCG